MKTSLDHLPSDKQDRIRRAVEVIVATSSIGKTKDRVAMIVLFGSYARGNFVDDLRGSDDGKFSYHSDFDLLVVMSEGIPRKTSAMIGLRHAIERELGFHDVNNLLRREGRVRLILHEIADLNWQLELGHYFFHDILDEGVLLYDTEQFTLKPRGVIDLAGRTKAARKDFDQWFDEGQGFLLAAEAMSDHGRLTNAAFQLHQAAERFFNVVELVFCSYKSKTHSIIDLIQITGSLHTDFFMVFPRETTRDRRILELMHRAYVTARYWPKEYEITASDLAQMMQCVRRLEQLAEQRCEERIASMQAEG